MRKWMKVFVLCMWALIVFVIGNTMPCANQQDECPVFEQTASQEQIVSEDSSYDIQRCINHLLSSRYVDFWQHSVVGHSGNSYDFKFMLRAFSVFLLHQTDYQLHKLYKLTHSTHPRMSGGVDYYIYTLERILI